MGEEQKPTDEQVLASFLRASSLAKVFEELWQTAAPGLRQQLADAIVSNAVHALGRGSSSEVNAHLRDVLDAELRILVAGVIEERRVEIRVQIEAELEKGITAAVTQLLGPASFYTGNDVVLHAMEEALKRRRNSR